MTFGKIIDKTKSFKTERRSNTIAQTSTTIPKVINDLDSDGDANNMH